MASFSVPLVRLSLPALFELAPLVNTNAAKRLHGTLKPAIVSHEAKSAAVAKVMTASAAEGRTAFEDAVRTETARDGSLLRRARALVRMAQSVLPAEWAVITDTEMNVCPRNATTMMEPRIGGVTWTLKAKKERCLAGMA